MKKKLRIANRRRFVTVISALFFILGVVVSAALMLNVSSAEDSQAWVEVVVQEGDTVWAIAREHSVSSEDIRTKVHTIISENNLDGGHIYPGSKLLIPVISNYDNAQLQVSAY